MEDNRTALHRCLENLRVRVAQQREQVQEYENALAEGRGKLTGLLEALGELEGEWVKEP